MNELQIFNNSEFGEIRTVLVNNEPMFCLSDICKILEISNPTDVKKRLNQDGVDSIEVIDSIGRKQNATFINESNLYKTIFQSRKESAERFTEWVTSEVLPSIRKHGVYMTENVVQQALSSPDFLIQLATQLKEEQEKRKELENSVQQMDAVISTMTPKVDYADRILSSTDCMTTSQVAQDYGYTAKMFNKILFNLGIQRKIGEQWILYSDYQGKGYVKTRTYDYNKSNGTTGTRPSTVWTQKGRMFLYEKLKAAGIIPTEEIED